MEKAYFTNATHSDLELWFNHEGREFRVELPKYILNKEVIFVSKEEHDAFLKFYKDKIDSEQILVGKSKDKEALKAHEKEGSNSKKHKKEVSDKVKNDFEKRLEATIQSENSGMELTIEKGKESA